MAEERKEFEKTAEEKAKELKELERSIEEQEAAKQRQRDFRPDYSEFWDRVY